MKKEYVSPQIDVMLLFCDDIITVSSATIALTEDKFGTTEVTAIDF